MRDVIEVECRSARIEAEARIGGTYEARVLEPSPPAAEVDEYLADDPVARGDVAEGLRVIAPGPTGDKRWIELDADDPELAGFCMTRWLGPYKRLNPLPEAFATTRDALHRLATHVVYRARRQANGKYGLRWTLGGFGTPFFGADEQVRVDGDALVHQRSGRCEAAPIGTLREAGEFVGVPVDPDFDHGFADVAPMGDPDADLAVDIKSAVALGDWFGFAWSVLEEIRADHLAGSPTRPQLWPEHFDAAIDFGYADPIAERRVNIGFSPGDALNADPYLYVGPWTNERPGDGYWTDDFGAVLGYDAMVAAGDQRAAALDFVHRGVALLRT